MITIKGKGTQQTDAAELLAQCLLLKGFCVTHINADHMAALVYARQAETYSKLAGNPILAIVAARVQAATYNYVDYWKQALDMAERAKNMIEVANKEKSIDMPIPSLVQSSVYIWLATYQAYYAKQQEALKSLRLAEETFEASRREAVSSVWDRARRSKLISGGWPCLSSSW